MHNIKLILQLRPPAFGTNRTGHKCLHPTPQVSISNIAPTSGRILHDIPQICIVDCCFLGVSLHSFGVRVGDMDRFMVIIIECRIVQVMQRVVLRVMGCFHA